ncbi:MAG: methyltransferase domain-containing protein [Vicinamibacterales bacterium]
MKAIARVKSTARQAWMSVFSSHPYEYAARAAWLGALVRRLPRSYVDDIERGVFTGRGGLIGAIVRGELERKYYASPDAAQQRRIRDLWGGEAGRAWHADKLARYSDRERFEREYLPYRQPLVDALTELLARDRQFHTLCEIGTGNGLFLRYLSDRLPAMRFVGIDLNADQIAANRQVYGTAPLEFESIEALDWIEREGRPGTLFVACGTLECLTGQELHTLLRRVAGTCTVAAFGIVEPVSFDIDTEVEARPRGAMTYSHSYPRVFAASGFTVRSLHRRPIDARVPFLDSVSMLAVCGDA